MGKDENGNPKVLYDDPKKAGGADKKGKPKVEADSPKDVEKCTINTDKVDRESTGRLSAYGNRKQLFRQEDNSKRNRA